MAFICGMFVGSILGVIAMSLCFVAGDSDNSNTWTGNKEDK